MTHDIDELSREEADALYRTTQNITNPEAIIAGYISDSADYRSRNAGVLDIAYGYSVDECFDLFLPTIGATPAPVHIFLHGGYWYQGGKHEWSFLAEALVAAGAIVVVPRYSLCPTVSVGEIVGQMRSVVACLWKSVARYGGDPGRIFLSGHSAGGHLATQLLLTNWERFGLPVDVIRGVTSISGLYDLRPLVHSYLQEILQLSAFDARRLSPLLNIRRCGGDLLLVVGSEEPGGFLTQMAAFAEAWREVGNTVELLTCAGHHHFSLLYEMSRMDGQIANAICRQMGLMAGGRHLAEPG